MSVNVGVNNYFFGGAMPRPPVAAPAYIMNPVFQAPAIPSIPNHVHQQTQKLIGHLSEISFSVLSPNYSSKSSAPVQMAPAPIVRQPAAAAPNIHVDLSDRSWRMFNNETHVHHHHHNGTQEEQKKDDTGMRILVGLIGLVIAGIAAFCIGKAMAEGEESEDENSTFDKLKTHWDTNKFFYAIDYQQGLNEAVHRADSILQREQTHRTHKIALLVLGFIAGGTAIAGALIGSTPVMLAAAGIGACVALATLYKLGYAYFSKRDQKDASAIDQELNSIRQKQITIY